MIIFLGTCMKEWLYVQNIQNVATTVDHNAQVVVYGTSVIVPSLRRLTREIFLHQKIETDTIFIGEITQEGVSIEIDRLFHRRFVRLIEGGRRQVFLQGTEGSCYLEKHGNMYTVFQYENSPDMQDSILQKDRGRFFGNFTVTIGDVTTLHPDKLVYGIRSGDSYETAHFAPQKVSLGELQAVRFSSKHI